MKAFRLCLIVGLVLVSASCSLKTNWDLVGKWQKVEGTETLEFSRNGLLTLTNKGVALTCQYKFTDPKHMEIRMGSLGGFVMKVAVSGGVLTMTDAEGKVSKYEKASAAAHQAKAQKAAEHQPQEHQAKEHQAKEQPVKEHQAKTAPAKEHQAEEHQTAKHQEPEHSGHSK